MHTLASFIRMHRQSIVGDWLARVRALPAAAGLPTPLLADQVPQILDALADALEREDATAAALEQLPLAHAAERYRTGFDLRQVIAEYRMLRRAVVEAYKEAYKEARQPNLAPFATLNELVDRAIGDAVDQFALEHDRTRDFFVGVLAHDLRNPLNATGLSAAALLQMSAQGDALDRQQVAQLAGRVSSCVTRMQRMIADILYFARGRLGNRFPITPVPSDLRPVIVATVQELAVVHPAREIRCLVASAPGDFTGTWDTDRVAQVVSNLVSNAIQHGQDPIAVEACDEGERIRITVRDSGYIPPDRLPLIFDPFRSGTHTGTRLGLHIVREIARAHGGTVDVESNSGTGTAFGVTLPRRLQEAPASS